MKNKNETMNIIEEKKPEYAEDAFKGVVPEFSFSVNGTQVVIRVKAIVGAENYEVYQSETPRGKYAKVVSTATPVIEFYVPDGKSYYYKVRAFHGIGDDKATTDYSKPQYIDLVTERIQINLCVDCFDKVLDTIVSMCKINPVVDGDWMEHCLKKNDGVIYISRRLGSGGDYKDTPRKRIFIDMDGVLCEYRPEASVDDMMQNGYFASLKPRKEMLDAVKGLIKFGKYDVYVLSAVIAECAEQSKFEKNEWLDRYIPEIGSSHRIFTLCGTNKADAVESITLTDILLDDHSPNLEAWINAGGKAIKVLNECNGMNGTFVTGPRIKIDSTTTLLRALTNI